MIINRYPFINFIQKNDDIKGQGQSLNLILDLIKTYTYWIHWEEAWYCDRPFLFEAIQIIDNTNITQLQFTREFEYTHWEDKIDKKFCQKMPNENDYCIINYDTVVVHASGLGLSPLSLGEGLGVRLYPNPVNDILIVEFVTLSGVEASTTKYSIINSLGQIIREEVLRPAQQPNSILAFKIKVNDLSNGVYILKLSSKLFDSAQSDNLLSVSKRFVIAR